MGRANCSAYCIEGGVMQYVRYAVVTSVVLRFYAFYRY